MGSRIAQSFVVSGYSVVINDIKVECLSKAKGAISDNLALLVEEGVLTEQEKQHAQFTIAYTCDLGGQGTLLIAERL